MIQSLQKKETEAFSDQTRKSAGGQKQHILLTTIMTGTKEGNLISPISIKEVPGKIYEAGI